MFKHSLNIIQRSACGGLSQGGDYNCDNPIVAGVDQRLILIDKTIFDRATIVEDGSIDNLITDITLTQTGDVGYAFQGIRKSLNPQSAFVPSAVSYGFDHQVEFIIFDIDQDQKNNIQKMAGSKMVAIIQNTNAEGNGDAVFEVMGTSLGMELQAGPMRINGDLDSNGGYTINLKTSDETGKEPKLPNSFWDTDFATTKTKVDSLLIPVV